jgi:glycosyltransferase involved in cell wall biosynthesis
MAGLKAKDLSVHGLIVGEPHSKKLEFLGEVKKAIQTAGLQNDITLVGHRSDLREVMSVSDAVVSCSTDPEAFGRVTLEALSIGKPVAGYDHGGVHEQLDALLPKGKIPVGDTEKMTQTLAMWHARPESPNMENPFTLERMLQKTLSIYSDRSIS